MQWLDSFSWDLPVVPGGLGTTAVRKRVSGPGASPLQRPTRCSVFWGHRGQQKQLSSDSCWEFLGMQKLPSQSLTEESSRTRPPPLIPICSE